MTCDMTFKEEMRQQPEALRKLLKSFAPEDAPTARLRSLMHSGRIDTIIFTGMGSSLFAAYIPTFYLRRVGVRAMAIESAELLLLGPTLLGAGTLVVAVSQSGESVEVIELARRLPNRENLVIVTNYPNSQLHAMSDIVFEVHAGIEYLTSTKTYTNTVAVLQYLGCVLAGDDAHTISRLRQAMLGCADRMQRLLESEASGEMAAFISDIKFLLCVGSGYSYASASHCEIVLEEAGKFFSSRYTSGQFLHGPVELIQQQFGVVLFDFHPDSRAACAEVCKDVLDYGGKVLHITNAADAPRRDNYLCCHIPHKDAFTAPLLEVIPIQTAVNDLCVGRGEAPGRLSRVMKRIVQ